MEHTETAIAGTWYTITCTAAATVTETIGGETAKLATLSESGTAAFRASTASLTITTDGKYVILPTKAPIGSGSGDGGALSGSPKSAIPIDVSSGAGLLYIRHDWWFINESLTNIVVNPSTNSTRVQTCYLQTSIPVKLSGVTWLYGEPAMVEGYTYVIAMQQINNTTVAANLAYTLPK